MEEDGDFPLRRKGGSSVIGNGSAIDDTNDPNVKTQTVCCIVGSWEEASWMMHRGGGIWDHLGSSGLNWDHLLDGQQQTGRQTPVRFVPTPAQN